MNMFPNISREHGGVLSVGKRRARRPLSTKQSLHVTLKSEFATNARSLLKFQDLIHSIIDRAALRFRIRIYQRAIAGNHLHLLIRGKTRTDIQNFFRVFAGHIAQEILRHHPLNAVDIKTSAKGCAKNQRKFWSFLVYSRVITWGREFKIVSNYVIRNTLEVLCLIAYRPRKKRPRHRSFH